MTNITKELAARYRVRQLLLFTGMDCSLRCTYCEPAGMRLLTPEPSWKPIESIQVGDQLVGFEQDAPLSRHVRFLIGTVTATATRRAMVYRIVTDKGEVLATGDHLWFTAGCRWRRTDRLRPGHEIRWVSAPIAPPNLNDSDYMLGYLAGVAHGDGTFMHYQYEYDYQANTRRDEFRLAVKDDELLGRFAAYLDRFGFEYRIGKFNGGPRNKSVNMTIYITGRMRLRPFEEAVRTQKSSEAFARGFLAGLFDADGSFDGQNVRIYNQGSLLLRRAEAALEKIGLRGTRYIRQNRVVALTLSSRDEAIRFFAATQPAIMRKRKGLFDASLYGVATVQEVVPESEQEVFSIETTTGTYISEGFASHNCFLSHRGPRTIMPVQVLHRAIDFLWEITAEPPSLHFFGTEPTMHWALIEKARKYTDMPISMTTNGYLLTRKRIDWCNEHDVKIYVYSIDGGPEHNRQRLTHKGKESWEIVARHFRYLNEFQGAWLTARATWTPSDYDLAGRFQALESLGAKSIQVVPDIDGPPWDETRVEQAYLELGEHYRWGGTPSKYVNDMVSAIREGRPKPGNPCNFGYGYWAVMPDGELRACQRGEPIGDVWSGVTNPLPLYESALCTVLLDSRTFLTPECESCIAFPHCPGPGFCCAANREKGNPAIPTKAHCTHLRGMVRACTIWAKKQQERGMGKVIMPQVLGVIYDREAA